MLFHDIEFRYWKFLGSFENSYHDRKFGKCGNAWILRSQNVFDFEIKIGERRRVEYTERA